MKQNLDRFLGWVGVLVAAGGYASSLLGLLDDPFYVFAALLLGVGLAGWNYHAAETEMEEHVGLRTERVYRRSPADRLLAKRIFFAAVAVFLFAVVVDGFAFLRLADVRAVTQRPLDLAGDELSSDGSSDLPIVNCLPLVSRRDLASVAENASEGMSLTVTKRRRIPWTQIDEVAVVVEKFEAERAINAAAAPAAIRPPLIYLAHIDRDVTKSKRIFPARYVDLEAPANKAPDSADSQFAPPSMIEIEPVVLIEDEKPTRLIVKVNAEAGGVYTYRIQVRFRYLWQSQVWRSEPRTVRFREFTSGPPVEPAVERAPELPGNAAPPSPSGTAPSPSA